MKRKIKIAIDIIMLVSLVMLMAYSLIGETLHELLGTLIFVLFIAHHALNAAWIKSLFKGKYTAKRIFQIVLNISLFVLMIVQPICGILISKHLYTFIKISGISATVRELHLCLAYWCFVLMNIHVGTHLYAPLKRLKKQNNKIFIAIVIVSTIISSYGIYAFIRRKFAEYMFLSTKFGFFTFNEPLIIHLFDYISVMALFSFIGTIIIFAFTSIQTKKNNKLITGDLS